VVFGVPGYPDGLVRQVAVGDYERAPDFPNVPTLKELGYDLGYNTSIYLGLSARRRSRKMFLQKSSTLMARSARNTPRRSAKIAQAGPASDPTSTAHGLKIHRDKEKIFKELIPRSGSRSNRHPHQKFRSPIRRNGGKGRGMKRIAAAAAVCFSWP